MEARQWEKNEPIEAETRAWLREFGILDAAVDVRIDPDERRYPVTLVVTVSDPPVGVTDESLKKRLIDAWDVSTATSSDVKRLRQTIANEAAYNEYKRSRVVTYDRSGLRSDIPPGLRPQLLEPEVCDPADPGIWSEPDYSTDDPDYLDRLGKARRGMYEWDHDTLWKHLTEPQQAGYFVFYCNDDGLAATEDPLLVSHVSGIDSISPYLAGYGEPVRADDLLKRTLFIKHRRRQHDSAGLLLRESSFSHYIDYPIDKRNPGWEPHPAIGCMCGWVVHPEASPPYAEVYGTNNAAFAPAIEQINSYLAGIGRHRIEWAVAHDLLVTGRAESAWTLGLRMFVGDILIDLIVARAGYLHQLPGEPWRDRQVKAIPPGHSLISVELVVEDRSLLDTRHTVWEFADTAESVMRPAVRRSSGARNSANYPSGSILVRIQTADDDAGNNAVRQLAGLLGVSAAVKEGGFDRGWTSRIIEAG